MEESFVPMKREVGVDSIFRSAAACLLLRYAARHRSRCQFFAIAIAIAHKIETKENDVR